MVQKTKPYKGFELSWEEPPRTSAGYEVSVASNDPTLQRRLEEYCGRRGADTGPAMLLLAGALKHAEDRVDAVLGHSLWK